jgi:hypothetical protein
MDEVDFVSGCKSIGGLDPDIQQPRERQCTLAVNQGLQILPFHEFHHNKIETVDFFDGVNRYDVWMVEGRS